MTRIVLETNKSNTLKNDFKAKCAKEGKKMKEKLEELVREYTYDNQTA